MDLFECESIFTIPFAISHLAQKSRKRDERGMVRRRKEAMNGEMGRKNKHTSPDSLLAFHSRRTV